MRQLTAVLAVAAIGISVAACGGNEESKPASSSATKTTTTTTKAPPQPPVAQAALPNLLLSPAEVDGVLGLTGTVNKQKTDNIHPGFLVDSGYL